MRIPAAAASFARGFSFAGQGVWHAVRTQRNMRVHLTAAAAAIVVGAVLRISAADWACVALAIGMVLAAEIFNTVIEAIIDMAEPGIHPLAKIAKDGAAGAVLVASLAAVGVAVAVFVPRLLSDDQIAPQPRGICRRGPRNASLRHETGRWRPYPSLRTDPRRPRAMSELSRSERTGSDLAGSVIGTELGGSARSRSTSAAPGRRAGAAAGRSGAVALVAAALLLGSAGCSVLNKINSIRKGIDANRKVIQTFTQGLKNTKAMPFQVTYVTSGSSPTTVTYSVRPPNEIAFKETSVNGGSSSVDLIANSSGSYSCSQPSAGAQWACQKLGPASAASQQALFSIYTPSHWITFLDAFSIAAGVAGDKVSTSTMTVNGFSMHCIVFTAKGVKGTSTICTTAQNILGYVKVAGQATSFQVKSYTATPPASAFQLPPGASLTNAG